MSEQVGGILNMNGSYQFDREKVNDYKTNNIASDNFFAWQKDHMYKSTYNERHGPNVNQPKNTAIPGYMGFIPGIKADSQYGRSKTIMAKNSLNRQKLDVNRTGLATTGFNITKDAFIDKSKLASSSKYGKTGLQKAHPNWSQQWKTTNQIEYQAPTNVPNPLFRDTQAVGRKQENVNSGYSQNHAYLDGNGWKPHPILTPQNIATEYRNRFNPQQQYHRDVNVTKERKMKQPQMNYHYNY